MKSTLHLIGAAALLLDAVPLRAQIPNGSFEDWTSFGAYEDPTGWTSLNILTDFAGADPSCEQGTPGAAGNSHVVLTCRDVPDFGMMPGMLISGDPNAGADGFPFTTRPEALTGQWQFAPVNVDQGIVTVTLSRWDAELGERVAIGIGQAIVTTPVEAWESFTATIVYDSDETPDTASIALVAGTVGNEGTALWVDDLAFTGSTGVIEASHAPVIALFPSPATTVVRVTSDVDIRNILIFDATGRVVVAQGVNARAADVDVQVLPAGVYHLRLLPENGLPIQRTFIKD